MNPDGTTVDSSGWIYISDLSNDRVVRIDGSGWTTFGSLLSGENQLSGPWGMAVNSKGYVYIAAYNNNRIARFAFP